MQVLLGVTCFAVHLALLAPALVPTLRSIGDWDESWYIYWGHRIHDLHPPALSANPLVGALYALIYPFAKNSELWLVTAARIGRVAIATAAWLVLLAVTREAVALVRLPRADRVEGARPTWAWLGPALLFSASAVPAHLIATPNYQWGNPSDAVYAVLSGAAFWAVLRYYRTRALGYVALASAVLGGALLSRMDGLVLSGAVLSVLVAVNLKHERWWKLIGAAALPFGFVLGGYLLTYAAVQGTFTHGVSSRSYQAFEEGHAALRMTLADWRDYQLHARPMPFDEDLTEVRRIFGSPEDNAESVFKALLAHPDAAIERLSRTLASIPNQVIAAYGELVAIPLCALVLRGLLALWRRRKLGVLLACACWIVPLGSYVLFFYRPGYFVLCYVVPFAMAAIGLHALPQDLTGRARWPWIAGLALAVLVGAAANRPLLSAGACVALGVVCSALASARWTRAKLAGLELALAAAFLAVASASPKPALAGYPAEHGAEERAVLFLRAHLPSGSTVAAFGPGPAWTANPTFQVVQLEMSDGSAISSRTRLLAWMKEHRVDAVYINSAAKYAFADADAQLSAAVGEIFELAHGDSTGNVRVLLTRPEFLASLPPD